MKIKYLYLLLSLAVFTSCTSSDETGYVYEDGLDAFSEERYGKHIEILASDEFMGRMPFTEGETKTLAYLQQEYQAAGLQPGNGDSYLQAVPLAAITTKAEKEMKVEGPNGTYTLQAPTDYVLWTRRTEESISLENEELVFAGFGVTAPEYNWDDFEDVDVKDKIIVVFVNDPGFGMGDSTFFKGNTMTYYGRWTYKFEEAARRGAKGCLVIHDDAPAGYGYNVVANGWNTAKLYLDPRGNTDYQCAVLGWMPKSTAEKLFRDMGSSYAEKLAEAHETGFKAQSMNARVTTSMAVEVKYDQSNNVIGIIPGSTRPDEYIIYTAHWDHLGIGAPDETGDSIYNGALDNATGTASLLEIARAFNAMKTKPERSVVFLAVTAEEQGLLGAEYYAANPVFPLKNTVANINIDGVNPYGKVKDIVLIGKGQSDLEDYLAEEAKKVGRYVAPETSPEAGYFFRSDHFCFAKVGVPALFTETGIDLVDGGKEAGKKLADEYIAKYYHQPADEYDPARWTLDGAIADMQLFFQLGKRLAFETRWPEWKEGSEFKAVRAAYR